MKHNTQCFMNFNRLLLGFGLAMTLAGNALPAQQSEADRKQFEEIKAKAEKGDANAQYEFGKTLRTTNEDEAVQWFIKAAEQKHKEACFDLGRHFGSVGSSTHDPSKAFEFYLRGARLGHGWCAFFAGQAYVFGDGTGTNVAEGVRWVRRSADMGFVLAQSSLAKWYYDGKVLPRNLTNAIHYYRKAAEQGQPRAQVQLYVMLRNGLAVEKDLAARRA